MLKRLFLAASLAASLFLPNTTHAQSHVHTHNFTPIPVQANETALTEEQKIARAERTAACEKMKREEKEPSDIPLGFWGYGHAKAHCMGWIDELMERTNSRCCGGINSGECRLTVINMYEKTANIDGMWCAIGAAPVIIQGMGAFALVCAAKTTENQRKAGNCPNLYCKAVSTGG